MMFKSSGSSANGSIYGFFTPPAVGSENSSLSEIHHSVDFAPPTVDIHGGENTYACPDSCYCEDEEQNTKGSWVVHCNSRGLNKAPQIDSRMPIRKIDISYNFITILDDSFVQSVELLAKLEEVNLSYNDKLKMPAGPLLRSQTLKRLYIIDSDLHHIDPETFSELPALEVLYLYSNRIQHFGVKHILNLKNISYLMLDDNPLSCDCDLQRLRDYAADRKIATARHGELMCYVKPEERIEWSRITGYCTTSTQDTITEHTTSTAMQVSAVKEAGLTDINELIWANVKMAMQGQEMFNYILRAFKEEITAAFMEKLRKSGGLNSQDIMQIIESFYKNKAAENSMLTIRSSKGMEGESPSTEVYSYDPAPNALNVSWKSDDTPKTSNVTELQQSGASDEAISSLVPVVASSVVAGAVITLSILGLVLVVRWRRRKQQYVGASTLVRSWRGSPLPAIPRMPPAEYIDVMGSESHLYQDLESLRSASSYEPMGFGRKIDGVTTLGTQPMPTTLSKHEEFISSHSALDN